MRSTCRLFATELHARYTQALNGIYGFSFTDFQLIDCGILPTDLFLRKAIDKMILWHHAMFDKLDEKVTH